MIDDGPMISPPARPSRRDYALVALFCLLLFGWTMIDGRPLSLHSARLPETAREMMRNHNWLVPRSGGRPWLERPPLPHWIMIGVSFVLDQACDRVWVVRLPSVLMGTGTVLLTAWIGGVGFGRAVGLFSGYALATAFEFYTYSTLSEDDIYLAAIVALTLAFFVKAEFVHGTRTEGTPSFLGPRNWPIYLFFIATGLTNWIKSPLVGMAAILPAVGTYLLWNADWSAVRRYLWSWGIFIVAALTLLWPYLIYRHYPATIRNWSFDYSETDQYDQHFWYYPLVMPGLFMPWTPAVIFGLWALCKSTETKTLAYRRFLICWAILPVLVFSIPHRKHHHYLVPSLAPWAILAGVGIDRFGKWLRLALLDRGGTRPWPSVTALFGYGMGLLLVIYSVGQLLLPDSTGADTRFLLQVDRTVPAGALLTVNSDLHGEMDFFRNQFYVRPDAVLLHNLSFLRDEKISQPDVYVITRASDENTLSEFGAVKRLLQSTKTRRETSPGDRFTLFELQFDPALKRYPAPPADTITTKQAMDRQPGPWCGPPLTPPSLPEGKSNSPQ